MDEHFEWPAPEDGANVAACTLWRATRHWRAGHDKEFFVKDRVENRYTWEGGRVVESSALYFTVRLTDGRLVEVDQMNPDWHRI